MLVKTSRTGLGRRAGHDLTLEVTGWSADVVINTGDPAQSSVTVTLDTGSIEARHGSGGLKPLTDSDRADIKKTIQEKILHPGTHPEITFRSTAVEGSPGEFTINGDLTIMGKTQPATVHGHVGDDGRIRGDATISHSRWGIKPYSGFGGLLRVADEVQVQFDLAGPG